MVVRDLALPRAVFGALRRAAGNVNGVLIYCGRGVIYPSIKCGYDHVFGRQINAKSALSRRGRNQEGGGSGSIELTAGFQGADIERRVDGAQQNRFLVELLGVEKQAIVAVGHFTHKVGKDNVRGLID